MSIYASSTDDNDPSIIYSGSGWVLVTEDLDWRGTMHSTSVPGSWARFRFTGSRVVVICTIPTGDGQLSRASFQIDDGPAIPVSHRTTPPVQWQTQFWNSGPLSFGSHLLTITNLDDDAYFRMDRIDFDPTDSNAPRQSSTPRPTSTSPPTPPPDTSNSLSTPPTTSTTTTGSQNPNSSSSPGSGSTSRDISSGGALSSDSAQSSGLPPATSNSPRPDPIVITGPGGDSSTGAEKTGSNSLPGIIAGVLGGVLLLVFVGIGFYCLRRRRRRILRLQSSDAFDGPRMTQAEAGPMMPRPFTENGSSLDQSADYSSSSRLIPTALQTTIRDSQSKSRKPRPPSPIPETVYSPDAGSDIYVRSEVGPARATSAVEGDVISKAALASLEQRFSIDPSEAPPPAYHPTNERVSD